MALGIGFCLGDVFWEVQRMLRSVSYVVYLYLSFPVLFDRVDLLVVVLLTRHCSRRAYGSLLFVRRC